MPLVIPTGFANWHVHFGNSAAGASADSSIAMGLIVISPLDQTVVNRVSNLFRDGLKAGLDNAWTVGPCHVVEGGTTPKVWDDPTTEAGTASAADYPSPAVALVVSKRTGLAGRRFRGRFYYPGPPETLVSEGGIIDPTYLASMQTLFTNLLASVNGDADVGDCVLLHDSASPGPHDPTLITSLVARNVVGTMRPRQRR